MGSKRFGRRYLGVVSNGSDMRNMGSVITHNPFSLPTHLNTSKSISMRKLTAKHCLAIAVLIGSAGVSASADFQKGLTAYKSGDYATDMREWTPFAKQSNFPAQYNLGVMYGIGKGVIKVWVYSHMWRNIGTSNGNEYGVKMRDIAAKNMTPSQLEKHKTLPVNVFVMNIKGVELELRSDC